MALTKEQLDFLTDRINLLKEKEKELVAGDSKKNSTQLCQTRKWLKALRVIESLATGKPVDGEMFQALVELNPVTKYEIADGESVVAILERYPNLSFKKLAERYVLDKGTVVRQKTAEEKEKGNV